MSIDVHYFKQETLYTCGAAACRMYLSYYGIDKSESEIAYALGITPEQGCRCYILRHYLADIGLTVELKSGFSSPEEAIQTLKSVLMVKIPVIVEVNRDIYDNVTPRMKIKVKRESPAKGYSYHFVLVTGFTEGCIHFNDPHEAIGPNRLPVNQFTKALYDTSSRGCMLYARKRSRSDDNLGDKQS